MVNLEKALVAHLKRGGFPFFSDDAQSPENRKKAEFTTGTQPIINITR
jgi:hypothetical protein